MSIKMLGAAESATTDLARKTYVDSAVSPPAVRAYRSASVSTNATPSTFDVVTFDGEEFERNVAANVMHSTSSNASRLIAPVAGLYVVTYSWHTQNTNGVQRSETMNVRKNAAGSSGSGTLVGEATTAQPTSFTSSYQMSITGAFDIVLAANDYVEMFIAATSASVPVTVGATKTWMGLRLVSL